MAQHASTDGELVPIDEVARRFGVQASALRYYERRGLLQPASKHSGRRWYGSAELRRLAIIGFWQQSGLMTLQEIAAVLAGPKHNRGWKQIVRDHRQALDTQIEQMTTARDYLDHMLTCPREHSLDGCPEFEEAIWRPHHQGTAPAGGTRPGNGTKRERVDEQRHGRATPLGKPEAAADTLGNLKP